MTSIAVKSNTGHVWILKTASNHKFYDIHNFKNKKMFIYLIIHIYYICLCDVKLPEDDLKKIETCRSITVLYAEVYF